MTGSPDGDRGDPLAPRRGIAAAVRLLATRPARLGSTRLVAVDGPSGSGKTSLAGPLADAIARSLGAAVVRPRRTSQGRTSQGPIAEGRTRQGAPAADRGSGAPQAPEPGPLVTVVSTDLLATWEHPLDWWSVLEHHLLAPLAAGVAADLPVVQWVSGNPRPGGSVHVPPVDVLVLEGVSSGRRAVAQRLSALVWIEVPDPARRLERAVARDGEGMRPFLARWQHDEAAHFAADRTRDRADVLIEPPG